MARVEEKFVTLSEDLDIFVRSEGDGERAIVFIPGWSCTHDFFENQFAAFANAYRTIFYDPRGAGRSSATLGGNNYLRHGEDLKRLLDALGVSECVLAAWSYGNHAVLNYFRSFGSDRVKGYVDIDSSPKPMSADERDWRDGSPDELSAYYQMIRNGQREFFVGYADAMVSRPLTDEERNWIVRNAATVSPFVAAATFADGHFSDGREIFADVSNAVATMACVNEESAPAARRWLETNAPQTQIEVFPSHMMFWEFPDRFNELFLEFCARAFGNKGGAKRSGGRLGFLTRR